MTLMFHVKQHEKREREKKCVYTKIESKKKQSEVVLLLSPPFPLDLSLSLSLSWNIVLNWNAQKKQFNGIFYDWKNRERAARARERRIRMKEKSQIV